MRNARAADRPRRSAGIFLIRVPFEHYLRVCGELRSALERQTICRIWLEEGDRRGDPRVPRDVAFSVSGYVNQDHLNDWLATLSSWGVPGPLWFVDLGPIHGLRVGTVKRVLFAASTTGPLARIMGTGNLRDCTAYGSES
jgi:hypothetical protein